MGAWNRFARASLAVTRAACDTAGVATMTLNRPERKNPLTFESYRELTDFFRACAFDDAVKVALEFQRRHPDTLLIVTGDHETGERTLELIDAFVRELVVIARELDRIRRTASRISLLRSLMTWKTQSWCSASDHNSASTRG